MQINGVTLNFSFFDPDFEEGKKAYLKELEEISKIGDTGTEPDAIRQQCDTVKHLFDVTFGEGTGEKVCGTGHDHLLCLEAYEALLNEQIRQCGRYRAVKERLGMKGAE